jgi:hypothetical protein
MARAAYHQSHRFPAIAETGLSAVATYDPYGTFSNACHVAIVAVDIATGQVEIARFVVVEDAGRLINPMIVRAHRGRQKLACLCPRSQGLPRQPLCSLSAGSQALPRTRARQR